MYTIGIDPGLTGAIAIIHDSVPICAQSIPVWKNGSKREIDIPELQSILKKHIPEGSECIACIENVHAMPGQGVTSMFNFGMSLGIVLGAVAFLNPVLYRPTPQRWKREMLSGFADHMDKQVSREAAVRLFPQFREQLKFKNTHGIAEALLLAVYAEANNAKLKPYQKGITSNVPMEVRD
jgi:crossover junction endodeoxyribonuclease RuvC